MATDLELEDMSQRQQNINLESDAEHSSENVGRPIVVDDETVILWWAWVSAILLLMLAIAMILFPRLLLFLSETGTERRVALTPLEAFMALHIGILLFAISLALIFNIPSNPLTAGQSATGHPLLGALSVACVLISFIAYNTKSVGSLSFLVFLGSGTIGLWGLWAIVFSGTSSISRKTGADKHTSRFIFGNKAAASVQKKRWKKEQGARQKDL
ncbi:hypothetical protein BV20DRAFT_986896 [Pilatotrama ljubarskyi]|nr:hypothetical protein BV20DRAFT_986896 [Pilatotrama ljubarskyi]